MRGRVEDVEARNLSANREDGAHLPLLRPQPLHELVQVVPLLLVHRAGSPRAGVRAHPRRLHLDLAPDRALVRRPRALATQRKRNLLDLRAAAARVVGVRRRRELAAHLAPTPRFHARHGNREAGLRRHEDRQVDDAILLGADQFLAVDDEHVARAVVDDLQLGHAAPVGHLRHACRAGGDRFRERVVPWLGRRLAQERKDGQAGHGL